MVSQSAWLRCMVSQGQFSEEYAVSARDHRESEFSLFVDAQFVELECEVIAEGGECEGRVQVIILAQQQGLTLVQLPGRTFENGSTVTVKSEQLEAIEASPI